MALPVAQMQAAAAEIAFISTSDADPISRRTRLIIRLATVPPADRQAVVEQAIREGGRADDIQDAFQFVSPACPPCAPPRKRFFESGWFIGATSAAAAALTSAIITWVVTRSGRRRR